MIPLKDTVRSQTFPIVNISIIVVNALVFFFELSLGAQVNKIFEIFGMIPSRFFYIWEHEPTNIVALGVPFITSIFLHGGWMHFIGNMLYLWIFGDNVEDRMGHGRYLVFYLISGIGAGIAHLYFNMDSTVPTIGASGAIAAVMGAYLVLYPQGRVLTLVPIFLFIQIIEIPAFIFLFIWIFLQIIQGAAASGLSPNAGGVAWWAHIGGFALGAILVFLFRKRRPKLPYY
ncbi:MAG: rhomboid family intramembrane serine protease [Calditrichae bacterium]|nr:rhomboid family intramembrane serine protease [Calditrichia bacterium]